MNEDDLFKLYERLYFHELERRERLSARLNVPLAVLVAVIGFLAFMLQSAPRDFNPWLGMWFFRKAWFGHTDKRFSSENTINNDARSYNLYRATSAITVAVLLAFVAFIPFYANRV